MKMPIFGEPSVEKLEAKQKTKGLLKALRHENRDIRCQAAEALGRLGDRRAVEPLTATLADRAGEVSLESARALGRIGDARATPSLLEVLQELEGPPKWIEDRRAAAAEALGRIGDQDAVEALVACLGEDSPVRAPAAGALQQLGWRPEGVAADVSYWVATQDVPRCVELGEAAVEPLLGVLEGRRSSRDRGTAAMVLGQIGDTRAVDSLRSAYRRATDPRLRTEIIIALGEIGDPTATDVLIAALAETRVAAVEALKKIGLPAIEPIVASLQNARLRDAAVELLDHFDWHPEDASNGVAYWLAKHDLESCVEIGPEAEPALIDRLKRGYEELAVEALAKIGSVDALEPLAAHRDLRWKARKAFDEVAVRGAAGRPLDDPQLALVLDTLRTRTVEPDRWTRGVDDDYKHFDDGWATRGSEGLAAAVVAGERLVASSLSGGVIDGLSDLDVSTHIEELFRCLTLDLDWHTKGLVAALLVESGVTPEDPRLQATIDDVRAWAAKLDEDVQIEPMVMELRRYEHQREAAQRILERLS